jgi:hypothetical protein
MKQRCYNEHRKYYPDYGGRGIKVCSEWHDFANFREWALSNGYQDNLSIDRIDVNGNYEPSNCRWTTNVEQQRNCRNNRMIEINGEKKCVSAWAELYRIKPGTIYTRLKAGWDAVLAVTRPSGKGKANAGQ